jgi:hypothetical protein
MTTKIILIISLLFVTLISYSKDYKASFFGIESNGKTLNTSSIQKGIDYIHENGGGRLVFSVGRYVTGTIYLKSNVTMHLKEGAVLVGSLNPFDYDLHYPFKDRDILDHYWSGMLCAFGQDSIGVTGEGMIDGRGYELVQNFLSMIHKGVIKDPKYNNDRPSANLRPQNIYFTHCNHVTIQGVHINNPASWNQQYNQCKNLLVEGITVDATNYWNGDGIDIIDCDSVIIRNNYFDTSDDAICLKSDPEFYSVICQNVLIYNNTIRSSASAIKFGTASWGGFKNIKIIKNTVFDTYRSAITFATVGGAIIENIVVDSLTSLNTGNVIFLKIGEKRPRKGSMKNISISNVYAEVPATKPDAGYLYEGPMEHMPRNISPASIVGMPHILIENVSLKNVEIHYPGGANPMYAKVGLDELDKVPELLKNYPEFSMFKELPAWGFYIRHAKGITFENVTLTCNGKDYRTAIILDDVHEATFNNLKVNEQGEKKKKVHEYKSTDIKIN